MYHVPLHKYTDTHTHYWCHTQHVISAIHNDIFNSINLQFIGKQTEKVNRHFGW